MTISRTLAGSVSLLTLAFACAPLSAQATGAAATQDCSAIADPTLRTACEQGPSSEVAGAQTIPGADDEASEEIIITGSRIRQTEFDAPNPVVSLDSANIQNAGTTNLTNFLQDIPALVGSSGSLDASGSAAGIGGVGLNLLNLRNLGVDRTLVLVDGRRHVAAVPGSSSVDVNTFPVDLIERVDVLTGAASAIYGADAVTGVVNFVLRRDFEGVQARLQAGTPAEGDATAYLGSLLVGKNFADGRGNIAVALEYGNEQALLPQDRRRFQPENFRGFYRNLADRNDDPNVPDFLPFADIRYFDSNPNGAIDVDLDFAPDFVGDGSVFDPGEYVPDIYQVGGSGTPVATYGGELIPNVERYVANVLLNYEFSDTVRAYAQGKYARVDSKSFGQPTFDFTLLVPLDNAYLPANVRDAAFAENGDFGVLVNRDNLDLGRRGERNRRETYRAVAGIVADLNDSTEVELSYVYGRSDVNSFQTNGRYNDRFFAAIDAVRDPATGNIVCRSNIAPATQSNQPFYNFQGAPFDFAGQPLSFTPGANSGCVPFNLFSQDQSQGALDFIRVDANDRSRLQQHVATIAMNGDLGDTVRLWGGPFSYALGAEYRHERSDSNPDPVNTTGLTFGNALFPETGSFDVWEAFGEARLPIIQDRPFAYDLTISGAARVSTYSTIGQTFTYQGSLNYAPVRDIRFRGTYAEAVRAPNIGELFGPQNQTFLFVDDPCSQDNLNNGTDFRVANCAALLGSLGLSPAQIQGFDGATSASIPGVAGGNRNLTEETARTFTAGVVLQPRFIPGFSLSVDFYDVRIRDAVSTPSLQAVADLCVDQPTLDNVFCAAIDRNPASVTAAPGVVNGFRLQPQNVAEFATRGVDMVLNYRVEPGDLGLFNFRLTGNYLDRLTFIPTPGGDVVDSKGTAIPAPEWQASFDLTYAKDNFGLNYGVNYYSGVLRTTNELIAAQPDRFPEEFIYFKDRWVHEIQASIAIDEGFTFYGGVNNLFNQTPDVGSFTLPVSPQGRFFYAGARVNLPSF